jgi:hypothetical protein
VINIYKTPAEEAAAMIAALMATNQLVSVGQFKKKKCAPVGKCDQKNCAVVTQNDCPTCYCYSNFLARMAQFNEFN